MKYNSHPLLFDALLEINANGGWSVDSDKDWSSYVGATLPSQEEVDVVLARLEAERAATEYRMLRAPEYPPIEDQLDALWKGGAAAEAMLAQIQAVKAKYPKPE